MANSTMFYQNRVYGVGIITFDLLLSESHIFNNNVTRYNVEDGADISDHIQNDLEAGSVSGLITNFSIYDGEVFNNKSQEAYDTIRDLWKKRQLVDIYTILQIYEQVAITNISINRDSESGESLICDFSFQEFNKVKLQEIVVELSIKLKDMQSKQNKQSSPNLNTGKNQGKIDTRAYLSF